MIGLLQRVRHARVDVQESTIAEIDCGLLVLIGVEKDDQQSNADRLLKRLLGYRVFADPLGKMNLSLTDVDAALLLVPQFTLTADTSKGMRPGFSRGATAAKGRELFDYLLHEAHSLHTKVASGRFGADMQVSLLNDGPVTFTLRA